MEFFTSLPPPSKRFYHTHEEQREIDRATSERASGAETVSIDFENCQHPESMFDESTNSCIACGMCNGLRAAALSENGINFSGMHCHTFSSATASAAARRKRGNANATLAGTVCFDDRVSRSLSSLKGGEVVESIDVEIERFVVQPSALKVGGWGVGSGQSALIKRATLFSEVASEIFSPREGPRHLSIIASGAYRYKNGEPCHTAIRLISSGMTIEELSRSITTNVYKIIAQNMVYFNTPQRRRLHHLALFVALIASHVDVVHASTGDACNAGACIELDRVLAKVKPSHSKFARKSLILAVSDRLGVSQTCSTRLVQDAHDLVFGASK